MSMICENVILPEDLRKKMEFHKVTDYVRLRPLSLNRNFPLGPSWPYKYCFLSQNYVEHADCIANMEVRKDDIWLVTFPKCGTTWSQEMIWLIGNNLDYETAKDRCITNRFPFLEFTKIIGFQPDPDYDTFQIVENSKSPRYIKTHLPAALLPNAIWSVRPKIIYVARNTKDVAISYYHHCRNLHKYRGSFEEFLELFLDDSVLWAPFHQHVLDFWAMRNEENILFYTYEDMKSDLKSVICKTAKFLGKSLSDYDMIKLEQHLSFNSMKENPATNYSKIIDKCKTVLGPMADKNFTFQRAGQVGSFKTEMSLEFIERFDEWTKKQLNGTDLNL